MTDLKAALTLLNESPVRGLTKKELELHGKIIGVKAVWDLWQKAWVRGDDVEAMLQFAEFKKLIEAP